MSIDLCSDRIAGRYDFSGSQVCHTYCAQSDGVTALRTEVGKTSRCCSAFQCGY